MANQRQNPGFDDRIAILKQKVIALPPKPPRSELTPYLEIIAILIELKNYSMPDVLEFLTSEGIKTYRQKIEYFKKRCEELGVWPTREQLLRNRGAKSSLLSCRCKLRWGRFNVGVAPLTERAQALAFKPGVSVFGLLWF